MNKKNLFLGGVLFALILIAFMKDGSSQNEQNYDNFLAKIDPALIERIDVQHSESLTSLEKVEDKWKVAGTKDFYVKDSVAESLDVFLQDIQNKDLELVSENPDKKDLFKTNEEGIRVKIHQGEKELSFVVGKLASDYVSSYVSEEEDQKTYKIKENLDSIFNRQEWRDEQIFSFDKENVTNLRFQYPHAEFTVEKKEDKWQGTKPNSFEVSEEKIMAILDVLDNLTATKIPEQTFEGTGLEKHLMIMQAKGEGLDITLMVGESDSEELFFVKRGNSDNIYLISKEEKEMLNKQMTDLK